MTRTVAVRLVGHERQPVAVVDNFVENPDALRTAAAAAAFGPAGRNYPGLRAALPPGYIAEIAPLIADILARVFALSGGARVLDASFSLVTAAPDTLTLAQRLPHVDATAAGRIALLHYLSPGDADGTAFYRHRATGYESIDDARGPAYLARLQAEIAVAEPGGYIASDTALFEQTAAVTARYNRALLYRSSVLHSGAITPGRALPADPLTGRLTITGFLAAA